MLSRNGALMRPAMGRGATRTPLLINRSPAVRIICRPTDPQRLVCHTSSSDEPAPAKKSVDKAEVKVSLTDIVNQLDPSQSSDKPKPWLLSRFLVFRALTKRLRLRRLGRRFLPRLLARLGRGVIVALPAIGLFFAFSLAVADYKRFKEERALGDQFCARCFRFATWMDLGDVFVHVVALLGTLFLHYNVGPGISPEVAHRADVMSPIVVFGSFIAATVGEFVSARRAALEAAASTDESMDDEDYAAALAT